MIGRHRGRAGPAAERQRVAAGCRPPDRDELLPGLDLPREAGRQAVDDLIVAAPHVELLVRLPEDPELPGADVAEEVEHVEGALLARLRAVLDVVGDVEELTEIRPETARHVQLDPVGDREPIEHPAARGRGGVRRRVAGGRDVLVELLPDRLEIGAHPCLGVPGVVEVPAGLRSRGLALAEVVEVEPELLGEVLRREMAAVDELAAVLVDLSLREDATPRPASAAKP